MRDSHYIADFNSLIFPDWRIEPPPRTTVSEADALPSRPLEMYVCARQVINDNDEYEDDDIFVVLFVVNIMLIKCYAMQFTLTMEPLDTVTCSKKPLLYKGVVTLTGESLFETVVIKISMSFGPDEWTLLLWKARMNSLPWLSGPARWKGQVDIFINNAGNNILYLCIQQHWQRAQQLQLWQTVFLWYWIIVFFNSYQLILYLKMFLTSWSQ